MSDVWLLEILRLASVPTADKEANWNLNADVFAYMAHAFCAALPARCTCGGRQYQGWDIPKFREMMGGDQTEELCFGKQDREQFLVSGLHKSC